jgi:hypothetical protein
MINNLIYKIKDEINNNNFYLIKKTYDCKKISSLAYEIINKEELNNILNIFHQVIKYVYKEKRIKTKISEFDLFHLHIIINTKNEIELLFHLFEYPKNMGLISNIAKKSNIYVNRSDFIHRNVIYNCTTMQFRFCYNFYSKKYATVEASSIGKWIGDIYLGGESLNKCFIFLLSSFLNI